MIVWSLRFLLLCVLAAAFVYEWPWYSYAIATALYIGVMVSFSFRIEWRIYLDSLLKQPDHSVALTFDDGPHPETTPAILDLLQHHNIKATFFLIGEKCEQYPELVHRIVAEGHQIANHSATHAYSISLSSRRAWREEIERCQRQIMSIVGTAPLLFRPPYGVTTPNLSKALADTGLTPVGWSLHTHDWTSSASGVLKRLDTVDHGDIVLLHDSCPNTVEALTTWLPAGSKAFDFKPVVTTRV
jgi:peptidoglycan/xylan/chitin deacetylase (PgdA/CDA1 family)